MAPRFPNTPRWRLATAALATAAAAASQPTAAAAASRLTAAQRFAEERRGVAAFGAAAAARRLQSDGGSCPLPPFLKPVPLPSPLPAGIAAALAAMNDTLSSLVTLPAMPGFAAAVWYNGAPVAAWGGGAANVSVPGVPPDPDAGYFRIASNTKVFMSLLAHVFADAGYLDLDDAVAAYAPDFAPLNTFDASAVTFRMLASHSAGLPDSLPGNYDWGNMTTAAVFASLATTPLQRPLYGFPGYSNLGISVLGHVLAEYVAPPAERGDLGGLLAKYVTAPLGLAHTGYTPSPAVLANFTPGYNADGSVAVIDDLGWEDPCGCMYSTVTDLNAALQAVAAVAAGAPPPPGFLLTAARARQFMAPVYYLPDGSALVGTPWEQFPLAGVVVRSKSGTLNGYATKSAVVPELALSFSFFFNGNFPDWFTGQQALVNVSAALVPAFTAAVAAAQPPRAVGPTPTDYVGVYAAGGTTATVAYSAAAGMSIFVTGDTAPGALEVVTGDTFRAYYDTTAADCDHVFMGNIVWGGAVVFQRAAPGGNVTSLLLIDVSGPLVKQPGNASH